MTGRWCWSSCFLNQEARPRPGLAWFHLQRARDQAEDDLHSKRGHPPGQGLLLERQDGTHCVKVSGELFHSPGFPSPNLRCHPLNAQGRVSLVPEGLGKAHVESRKVNGDDHVRVFTNHVVFCPPQVAQDGGEAFGDFPNPMKLTSRMWVNRRMPSPAMASPPQPTVWSVMPRSVHSRFSSRMSCAP